MGIFANTNQQHQQSENQLGTQTNNINNNLSFNQQEHNSSSPDHFNDNYINLNNYVIPQSLQNSYSFLHDLLHGSLTDSHLFQSNANFKISIVGQLSKETGSRRDHRED